MDTLLLQSLAAGLGVALMCGTLGCFVSWLRLSYFGDTIGHAALLGVALGLLLDIAPGSAVIAVSLLLAAALAFLQRERSLSADTMLGVLAHGSLALGLVLLAVMQVTVDVQAYLFGDILAASEGDTAVIYAVAALVLALLAYHWRGLMMMVLSADVASVEGVNVPRLRLLLALAIALVVAVSIKLVGMLLVTSLLIIPAASARPFARTPAAMAVLATLAAALAVAGGLSASFAWDLPAGPAIILAALALFTLSFCLTRRAWR